MKKQIVNDTLVKTALAILLIAFAAGSRLMPHPANFAPLAAVAIFGGAILPRRLAVVLPLAAMIISDLVIGMHPLILFTWGSFAIIALASSRWLKKINPGSIAVASLGASVFFFVVTNFAVWAEGRLYVQNFDGLVHCYYNALPFFRNTLLGDVAYTSVLFGAYAVIGSLVEQKKVCLALE